MGLDKQVTLSNGVSLEYHRITAVTVVVNDSVRIDVASYTSQDKRAEEQAHLADPENTQFDAFIDGRSYLVDYDPDMSVNKAYAYLKTLPEFQGAEDVIDQWAIGVSYYTGDIVMYQEQQYECIQPHASQEGWEPSNVPALWREHSEGGGVPEWVQPTGAHDAYAKGDEVSHDGKTWVSDIDANTYEPGVYGWTEKGGE